MNSWNKNGCQSLKLALQLYKIMADYKYIDSSL